jgi:hypothetical protein
MAKKHEVFVNGKNISPELSTENVDISDATQHWKSVVLAPKPATRCLYAELGLDAKLSGQNAST